MVHLLAFTASFVSLMITLDKIRTRGWIIAQTDLMLGEANVTLICVGIH